MAQRIRLIDAFVGPNARGNPAGVCLLDQSADDQWMQLLAEEMNQAETAFAHPEADHWRLRWFTPAAEVDLCGHATLATAHALFTDCPLSEVRFETRSGELICHREGDVIAMDFPAQSLEAQPIPPEIEAAFAETVWHGAAGADYMIVLPREDQVRAFQPDFSAIAKLGVRGLLITARAEKYDFISRFFAPQYGIPEDSVTGSAHCALVPFWADRLNKTRLKAFQASRRGGILDLELDEQRNRVTLRGRAKISLDGTFF